MTLLTNAVAHKETMVLEHWQPEPPLVMQFHPVIHLDDDQFFAFCQLNRGLHIERTAEGEVMIMPPAGGATSIRNATLTMQLGLWAKRDGSGYAFDSSGGFILPNGATRSPDAAWVLRSRLATLTPDQKTKFLPLCPDFVVELASPTDHLRTLQYKMDEYLQNGTRLGWLLMPDTHTVYVYRPHQAVEILAQVGFVQGDPILPGFTLDLSDIWEPGF